MAYKLTFTLDEVAKIFDRSVETLRFWITYKDFGKYGYKNSRKWYFGYEDLKMFLEEDAPNWMTKRDIDEALERLERKHKGGD